MPAFIVNLHNSSGSTIGDGPLQNVMQVSVTETLDEAGQVQFTLPATDYRAATLIDSALRFDVRFSDGTPSAYGLIGSDVARVATTQPTRTVTGQDLIGELANYSCGWWCFYDTDDLNTVVLPALLSDTGWSAGTLDASLGNFYGRFDGDSRLSALRKILAQTPSIHFRMGSTIRTLDVGAFATLSAVRFTNVDHALAAQDSNTAIAIIGSLQVTHDRSAVVNRIIPWGAGSDNGDTNRAKVKLFHLDPASGLWANIKAKAGLRGFETLIDSVGDYGTETDNAYTVHSTTGAMTAPIQQLMWCRNKADLTQPFAYDFAVGTILGVTSMVVVGSPTIPAPASLHDTLLGNPQLYIEDATAYAADPHEAVIVFNDITLTSLSTGSFAKGALQLYNRAARYLEEHKVARTTYTMTALHCPSSVRVGDKVRVIYHGATSREGVAYEWIDVDAELFVTKITRVYNADGSTGATVDVSNIATPGSGAEITYENTAQVISMNRAAG
jgi:hypothetical protein